MTDVLRSLPETQVAGWYGRLADAIGTRRIAGREPLSALFLRHWLANDPATVFTFAAPEHLRNSPLVLEVQQYHRRVFLTQEKARIGRREVWAGIVPRLRGDAGFTVWDLQQPLEMQYESLVEIPLRYQVTGTDEEKDLLTSLHGFQLRSRVTVTGAAVPGSDSVRIMFASWHCQARDRYDFDYDEYFTVPNPDFGSTRPNAVAPREQSIRVYHRNAQRLERAGLAAPYDLESNEWAVTNTQLTGTAWVTGPGSRVWESWIRRRSQATAVKLYNSGIIGVYATRAAAEAEKERDSAWQRGTTWECWVKRRSAAIRVKLHSGGIIGVFRTEDAAVEEASEGSPWARSD